MSREEMTSSIIKTPRIRYDGVDTTTLIRRDGDITLDLIFSDEESRRRVAVVSYELADAMEAARNKDCEP